MTQPATAAGGSRAVPTLNVASAPCSFGVDEVLVEDAWMPTPEEMLDWMAELDYVGTELGPPGFLGQGPEVHERLTSRGLQLVGSFLPQRFSRPEHAEEDRAWLRRSLRLLAEATPEGSRPFAVLSDGVDEPIRRRFSGRIAQHPEALLPSDRFEALISNLHRAAETAREAGFEPVIHPDAGTYIETADDIARVLDRVDPSLVGLCLDTGHFRYGGADPATSIRAYASVIRHVHVKDTRMAVIDEVTAEGGGLEEALKRGVFTALGTGDADIPAAIEALREVGYAGWLVVEQDQFLKESDTKASLVEGQRRNREYLRELGV
ncbi:MAG: TIM barrel protein [Chloroflexota bacterium]